MNAFWVRITVVSACILVASTAVAALVVYLGTMGYLALRELTTPGFAGAMIVLGGVTVVAVALTTAHLTLRHIAQPARAAAPPPGGDERLLTEIASLLGGELADLIRAKPYASAAASLAAGFAVGAVPELRGALSHLIAKR